MVERRRRGRAGEESYILFFDANKDACSASQAEMRFGAEYT